MGTSDEEYTIAVCNHNMAGTVEASIRSINSLVDDRFEIVVIDDGSTDGSRAILQDLESELDRVRMIDGDNANIGEARASAVDHARGDYILHQLDADDEYQAGILDFVRLFHQIDAQVDFPLFLSGQHIHMGATDLFRAVNYRSLGYNEDRDFWRRMIIHGSFIGLRHRSIRNSIGYERDLSEKISTRFEAIVTQLRSGITPTSYFIWLLGKLVTWRPASTRSLPAITFNLVALPLAYLLALREGIYDLPPEFSDMRTGEELLKTNLFTLTEIEKQYDVDIDRTELTDSGRQIFDCTPDELAPPRLWLNEQIDFN